MINKVYIENRPYHLMPGAFPSQIYAERCLTQVGDGDIVVTYRPVNPFYYRYLTEDLGVFEHAYFLHPSKYKRDLAYSVLKDPHLLELIQELSASRPFVIETYISSPHLEEVASIVGIPIRFNQQIFAQYGSKSGFRRLAGLLGIPVPAGYETGKYMFLQAQKFLEKYKEVVVKYDHTLGGTGVFKASSTMELSQIMRDAQENRLVIEEYVNAVVHGSVQIIIDERGCHYIVDECFQQGTSFKGFCYPSRFDPEPILASARPLARFLMEEGVRAGWFGIDFMISEKGEVFFHDFNPRKTAVSYVCSTVAKMAGNPEGILDRGIAAAYLSLPRAPSFETVRELLAPYLMRPLDGDDSGIIILNPGLLTQGLVNIAAVSAANEHHEMLERAIEELTRQAVHVDFTY